MPPIPDHFKNGNISWLFTKEYYNHKALPAYPDRGIVDYDYVPLVNIEKSSRTKIQEETLTSITDANALVLKQKSKWLHLKKWTDYSGQQRTVLFYVSSICRRDRSAVFARGDCTDAQRPPSKSRR